MALDAAPDLKTEILAALKSGDVLKLSFAALQKIAVNDQVVVDLNETLDSIYQLTGIVQGSNLLSAIPSTVLPADVNAGGKGGLVLAKVVVSLGKTEISKIDVVVAFKGQGNADGVAWHFATIGSTALSVTLDTITVGMTDPTTAKHALAAASAGNFKVGSLKLDVAAAYPDGKIDIAKPAKDILNLGAFFTDFGLPKVDFLDELNMDTLEFHATVPKKSFSLTCALAAVTGGSAVLIGPTTKPILALASASLDMSHAPGATGATIKGELLVDSALVLDITAVRDGKTHAWDFSGDINVAATCKKLKKPTAKKVTVADFADIFAGSGTGANVPSTIATIGVETLSIDYTYAPSEKGVYAIKGVFEGDWTVGGGLSATLEIDLTNKPKTPNLVRADFDLDGVLFTLGYQFGTEKIVSAAIQANVDNQNFDVRGTYDLSTKILDLQFHSGVNLAMLVAWFVGSVSGKRYYVLPSPWDEILSKIGLPEGAAKELDFKIDTEKKSVECTFTLAKKLSLFGVELDGFSITYSKAAGLLLALDGKILGKAIPAFDPANETPPKAPGKGGSILQIKLAAAGQHFAFKSAPKTIEEATNSVGTALTTMKQGENFPPTMAFNQDSGWLFAAHAKILEQADLQFIFNDPEIYGAVLKVTKRPDGKTGKLDVLNGLYASILYRKVNETVGVYEGTLILPETIRKINFGAFEITLPKFYLAIYTNGDFKVDVGFPYNLDFSNSLTVTAGYYSGGGGFYFAKLDGLDPAGLPKIPTNSNGELEGVFSPVTEIGIGFEIGLQKSLDAGILKASFAIMLQGLFQGTFAKYTRFSDNAQEEFFDVKAMVGVYGHVMGEIDFVIISAKVDITIFVRVGLNIIAHEPTVANVAVGVKVDLTVTINLFLFKIHIHCSFDMTVHAEAKFGEKTPAIWDGETVTMLLAETAETGPAPITFGWQPITAKNALTMYFLPQLTAGADYTKKSADQKWVYVGQLGLSNPAPAANGADLANAGDESYGAFSRHALLWALNAINNTATGPISAADAGKKTLNYCDIKRAITALGQHGATGAAVGTADIKSMFKAGLQITATAPEKGTSTEIGVGFFPILPGMSIGVSADAAAPKMMQAMAPVAAHHRDGLRRGGINGLPTRANRPINENTVLAQKTAPPQAAAEGVLSDWVILVIKAALQAALDADGTFADKTTPVAISKIVAGVTDKALDSIAGQSSRFMLHGVRLPAQGHSIEEAMPLYALTGQQVILTPTELGAANLSVTLNLPAAADWGITSIAGGGTSITLSSSAANAAIPKPKTIPKTPVVDTSTLKASVMPSFDNQPVQFHFASTIATTGGGETLLARLPQSLLGATVSGLASGASFKLWQPPKKGETDPTIIQPTGFDRALSIDFQVAPIPVPATGKPGAAETLGNTYALVGVSQTALSRLQQLIADLSAATPKIAISGLDIGYADGNTNGAARALDLTDVDFINTLLIQSNFSTETRPPMMLAEMASSIDQDAARGFIEKLWTGGVTNSGGYFLFYNGVKGAGLPPKLFKSGPATLTLVVRLATDSEAFDLPSYVNSLALSASAATNATELYLSAPSISADHVLMTPGHIGFEVTRTPPSDPDKTNINGSLDQLYNMVSARISKIGTTNLPLTAIPAPAGPIKPMTGSDWTYRHVLPLTQSAGNITALVQGGGDLPAAENPYQYIGKTLAAEFELIDVYGNMWGEVCDGTKTKLGYYDPILPISQLPYVTLNYVFTKGPKVQITMTMTPPVYDASGPAAPEECGDVPIISNGADQKAADLAAFARSYYQMVAINGTEQVAVDVALSAMAKTAALSAADLAAAIKTGFDTIKAQTPSTNGTGAAPIVLGQFEADLAVGDLTDELIAPLNVTMQVTRQGPFADKVDKDGSVVKIGFDIPPLQTAKPVTKSKSAPVEEPMTLDAFNAAFKTAFGGAGRILAVGPAKSAENKSGDNQLWIMRYGKTGINPSFDAKSVRYFAPRPLSNKLVSRDIADVRVIDPTSGGLKPATDTQTVQIRDVDLDAEMRKFIAALDALFAPRYAVPMALLNTDALNLLAKSKRSIVEHLVSFVTDLSNGDPAKNAGPMGTEATERYRQECLINLSAFYDMVSVAVVNFKTGLAGQKPSVMNAFGKPFASDPAKQKNSVANTGGRQFTLTNGKAAMDPAGVPMGFGLFAQNKTQYKNYAAGLNFQLSAIEHDIQPVDINGTTYPSGRWLKFLDAPQQISVNPSVEIPIPLRAFPTPPQLNQQTAASLFAKAGSDNATLASAKTWALRGTYQHAFVAQDTVEVQVELNHGLGFAEAVAVKDMVGALVQFNTLYPALQKLLDDGDLASVRTPEKAANKSSDKLKAALGAIATLADELANASWSVVAAPLFEMASPHGLPHLVSHFNIEDGYQVQKPTDIWQTRVVAADKGPVVIGIIPAVEIPGFDTVVVSAKAGSNAAPAEAIYKFRKTGSSDSYLKASQATGMSERVISVAPVVGTPALGNPMSVIDRQVGNLSMQILRNASLPASFHYETGQVTYGAPAVPLLTLDYPIECAGLTRDGTGKSPATAPLEDRLLAILARVLVGSGGSAQTSGAIQIATSFEYEIGATGTSTLTLAPVVLPVSLLVPTDVVLGPQLPKTPVPTLVTDTAKQIEKWLVANGLTPDKQPEIWKLGKLRFNVSLFSGDKNSTPILRLTNLVLPCTALTLSIS